MDSVTVGNRGHLLRMAGDPVAASPVSIVAAESGPVEITVIPKNRSVFIFGCDTGRQEIRPSGVIENGSQ